MINTAGLTPRQAQALKFISDSIAAGKTPSLDEIATALKLKAKSGAQRLVVELCDRGRITYLPRYRRSIQIATKADFKGYRLPADLRIALHRFCMRHGEQAANVVVDAVRLHLDACKEMA